jgi:hypothetical protein
MTSTLNTYLIKENDVFASSPLLVVVSVLVLLYAFRVFWVACDSAWKTVKKCWAALSDSKNEDDKAAKPIQEGSSDRSEGVYQVKIKLQKSTLSDGAVRMHHDWKLIQDRSGAKFTRELSEKLDRTVLCFCRNFAQDPVTASGDHALEQWFN